MDDASYRKLVKSARRAIAEHDSAEYRRGDRKPPTPEQFGITPQDVERVRAAEDRLIGGIAKLGFYVAGPILYFLSARWLYGVLAPDSIWVWVSVLTASALLAGVPLGALGLVALILSKLALEPLLIPGSRAAARYKRAETEYREWERRAQRGYWLILTPLQFEREVAALYERMGYAASLTPASGDRGIDIVLSRDGTTSVVQCKAQQRPVGPAVVRELIGSMACAGAAKGIVVSRSGFSTAARQLAGAAGIELVGLDELLRRSYAVSTARSKDLPGAKASAV